MITEATRTRSSLLIDEEAPPELVVDVQPDNAIVAAAATAVIENHFLENLLLDISTLFSFEQGKTGGRAEPTRCGSKISRTRNGIMTSSVQVKPISPRLAGPGWRPAR